MKKIRYLIILAIISVATCLLFACGTPSNGNEVEEDEPPQAVVLATPSGFSKVGDQIVWDSVEHATKYAISYKGEESETTYNHYVFSDGYKQYVNGFKVKALGDGERYLDSEWAIYVDLGYDQYGFLYRLLDDGSGYEFHRGNASQAMLTGMVKVPEYYNGLPVKRLAQDAFMYHTYGTPDVLPIPGNSSFMTNRITTSVILPPQLESIGAWALGGIINLEEIVIPDSVKEIERAAFYMCMGLKRVTLPKGLKVIPSRCFECCALEEINFPDTLEEIGGMAFESDVMDTTTHLYYTTCPNLTKVVIPEGVKKIGGSAFGGCMGLTEVILPSSLKSIGSAAFSRCAALENIAFPNGLESVGADVLYGTAWLNSQPDGWVVSGNVALAYKGKIPEGAVMEIPSDVNIVTDDLFSMQKNSFELIIPNGLRYFGAYVLTNTGVSKVNIPDDWTEIPEYFVSLCSKLKSIEIPSGITKIGKSAFNSTGLTEIVIPEGVTEIGETAFGSCAALERVVLPSGLKYIGLQAFRNCKSLKEIVIPKSVDTIIGAFTNCSSLAAVYYEGNEQQLQACTEKSYLRDDGTLVEIRNVYSNATVYYYSEVEPDYSDDNNYWRYVDGNPVPWIKETE